MSRRRRKHVGPPKTMGELGREADAALWRANDIIRESAALRAAEAEAIRAAVRDMKNIGAATRPPSRRGPVHR